MSLSENMQIKKALRGLFQGLMVVQGGIEPPTHGFSVVSCKSTEPPLIVSIT